MDEVRFGWIGQTRRAALEGLLAGLLEEWSREWWLGHASSQFSCDAVTELDAQARLQGAFVSVGPHGALAIHVGTRATEAIGRHLALVVSDDDAALAASLGEQALNDLAASIHRRAGAAPVGGASKQALPASLTQARHGAFAVQASLGRLPLTVLIDRRLGERLVPPASAAVGSALVPRREALSQAAVQVSATMAFGQVDLAQLADLAVGEVLVADRKLEDPLHIHVEGRGVVATGYLRRSGTQRAIVLDGAITREHHYD